MTRKILDNQIIGGFDENDEKRGVSVTSTGHVAVELQDQTSEMLDVFFYKVLGTPTLASPTVIDSNSVTLITGHGVVVGNVLVFKEGVKYYQGIVITVSTDTITLDSPLDFVFTTSASVLRGDKNMSVNGSVTPQIFRISPIGLGYSIDINKLIFSISDDVAMDSGKFGGIASLTKGVVVRKKNGIYKNIFNIKNNGDFALHCTTIQYDDKAPSGEYSFRAVKGFNGQEQQGVVVRLDPDELDELQIIIQDNLSGLTKFQAIAQGHIVV